MAASAAYEVEATLLTHVAVVMRRESGQTEVVVERREEGQKAAVEEGRIRKVFEARPSIAASRITAARGDGRHTYGRTASKCTWAASTLRSRRR